MGRITSAEYQAGYAAGYREGRDEADEDRTDWQPISTAPRDGTVVDLWSSGVPSGYRYPNAMWDVVKYRDFPNDEYGWTDSNHHGSIMEFGPFTHWLPLPPPPRTTEP